MGSAAFTVVIISFFVAIWMRLLKSSALPKRVSSLAAMGDIIGIMLTFRDSDSNTSTDFCIVQKEPHNAYPTLSRVNGNPPLSVL